MEILGFITALAAVIYASYRHHSERILRAELAESQEEKWFNISLCLIAELNRIGRRDLVFKVLNGGRSEATPSSAMDDLTVPDSLPEDF